MAKGPFMEFLRGRVTQAAINTYAETEIRTPASKTEKMAVLIHMIEFHGDDLEGTEGTYASVTGALLDRTSTAIRSINAPEVIAFFWRFMGLGRYQGTLTEHNEQESSPKAFYFDPPILYAKDSIWLAVNTAQCPSVKTIDCRVGYTLEKVSDTDFISALVE